MRTLAVILLASMLSLAMGCETTRSYRGDKIVARPMQTDPFGGSRLMTGTEFRELGPTEKSVEEGGLDAGYFRTPRR